MKILQIHAFHYIRGGAERYYFELSRLLAENGHEVAFFSTQDQRNNPSPYQKYFICQDDFSRIKFNWSGLKSAFHRLYHPGARQALRQLITDFKPDVAHLHNIYHYLSPSILLELKKQGIPIVMTAHDYKVISPNYTLFHHGQVDESTKRHRYYNIFLKRMCKESWLASFVTMIEGYAHQGLGVYQKYVDQFICPSKFMADKLEEYGIPAEKLTVLPNFVDAEEQIAVKKLSVDKPEYFIYAGRIAENKGVRDLFNAFAELHYDLKVVGQTENFDISPWKNVPNIQFLGFQEKDQLNKSIINSLAVIVPSIWYENCPYAVLEAFALGKPVIGSRIGGIPELVRDGETGITFTPGDVSELKEAVTRLATDQELCRKMGEQANELVKKEYNSKAHYRKLVEIYKQYVK